MNEVAEFAVNKLKEYSDETHTLPRSTTDLSPLEQWLIVRLYRTESLWKRAIRQVNKWRDNKNVERAKA